MAAERDPVERKRVRTDRDKMESPQGKLYHSDTRLAQFSRSVGRGDERGLRLLGRRRNAAPPSPPPSNFQGDAETESLSFALTT